MCSRSALLLAILFPAFAQSPSERIGTIDFFGYGALNLAPLRAALTFHEGDTLPSPDAQTTTEEALQKLSGRKTVISSVCCLSDGRSSLFIGLAEPDAPAIRDNPRPKSEAKLPEDILSLFQEFDEQWVAAVQKGGSAATEDDSQGYALSPYPPLRSAQQRLRAWARANTGAILHVLEDSRYAEQRGRATQALGYADRSPRQIAALVNAAFDPDEVVRNNAVRSLSVLCAVGPEVTRQIPADRFIPLLHSITWTDRNKASALLVQMTAQRDPALLQALHDQALGPLREMAQWKDHNHAGFAVAILGRIAGIQERRLTHMDPSIVREVLNAVK